MPTLTAFLTPETGSAGARASTARPISSASTTSTPTSPTSSASPRACGRMVADDGWVSIEVQHLLTLVEHTQFDTVYHEHFQYYTVLTGQRALASGGLDAGRRRAAAHPRRLDPHVGAARRRSRASRARPCATCSPPSRQAGLHTAEGHDGFAEAVSRVRDDLVAFLIEARRAGKKVVGYGAPGKGNTLLNYCGIRPDLLAYTVDRNPYKHGRFTPGTRIPILAPERIADGPARLRADPAVEPARRAHRAAVLRPRLGRQPGLPDPAPRGRLHEGRPVLRRLRHADARRRCPTCPSR